MKAFQSNGMRQMSGSLSALGQAILVGASLTAMETGTVAFWLDSGISLGVQADYVTCPLDCKAQDFLDVTLPEGSLAACLVLPDLLARGTQRTPKQMQRARIVQAREGELVCTMPKLKQTQRATLNGQTCRLLLVKYHRQTPAASVCAESYALEGGLRDRLG